MLNGSQRIATMLMLGIVLCGCATNKLTDERARAEVEEWLQRCHPEGRVPGRIAGYFTMRNFTLALANWEALVEESPTRFRAGAVIQGSYEGLFPYGSEFKKVPFEYERQFLFERLADGSGWRMTPSEEIPFCDESGKPVMFKNGRLVAPKQLKQGQASAALQAYLETLKLDEEGFQLQQWGRLEVKARTATASVELEHLYDVYPPRNDDNGKRHAEVTYRADADGAWWLSRVRVLNVPWPGDYDWTARFPVEPAARTSSN